MGVLVDDFGGKISGELIKATDWNGMLAAVEQLVGDLQASFEARITPLETSVGALQGQLAGMEGRLVNVESLTNTLRQRYRNITLSAPTTTFAIGQRGVLTANVTSLDGSTLDLSNAATRPWVDFVTGWGTLKAAPGFTTRGGANDKTVSVQVNASGQAQVLIRAEHAEAFDEDEELEIEAVLGTQVAIGAARVPISQAFLNAETPASVNTTTAYRAITQAYHRTDTTVMQRYLDTYAVLNPARLNGNFTSRFNQRWRDYRATVLAFVKPDADPTSPDGAMASGSIQVTFRDWIGPWIIVDYFPNLSDRVTQYRDRFTGRIGTNFDGALAGILNEVDNATRNLGILGKQRDLAAAHQAIGQLSLTNPPPFFGDLVGAISGGLGLQQTLSYGEAITPNVIQSNQAVRALANSTGKAVSEASRVQQALSAQITNDLSTTSQRLLNDVQVAQTAFREDLLRDDGVILGVQSQLVDIRAQVQGVNLALGNKADLGFVTDIVRIRG